MSGAEVSRAEVSRAEVSSAETAATSRRRRNVSNPQKHVYFFQNNRLTLKTISILVTCRFHYNHLQAGIIHLGFNNTTSGKVGILP